MTGTNFDNAGASYTGADRRANFRMREIFEQAYLVALPMLESEQAAQPGSATHFLRVVLHDVFPDLHPQDVSILSVSIERVYRERSRLDRH
jgi:hypothetical protein